MSRTLRILLAGMVAAVFASASLTALTSSAVADQVSASDQRQAVFDRHEVAPEDARPGGGAAPFDTAVVIVLNTLLLGGLLGGVLWARGRLGSSDAARPRLSV